MKRLYDYLMAPERTVQLFNHQKNWQLWWLIIGISGLLSALKWASVGVFSVIFASALQAVSLVIFAVIIDASAQLMGQRGQLKNIVYWLAFASTITWLLPSMSIIQHSFLSLGSLLVFAVNIIYFGYVWKTLKRLYNATTKTLLMIVTLPAMLLIILIFAIIIFIIQQAVTI